jgi:hypothetical protein
MITKKLSLVYTVLFIASCPFLFEVRKINLDKKKFGSCGEL